ncbi:cupin-like domain-containing protein [Streptomyces salinarius]|uniref:cupin-like domain-containing protein n=1 Tax=Streptomyces salinarius TaxID=2762598 RepID=UPI0013DB9D3E|nr:cupin-like domain-containing protein [Streptomyces salinarius]
MTVATVENHGFPVIPQSFWDEAFEATAECTRPAVLKVPDPSGRLFRTEDVLELGASIIKSGDVSVNVDGTLVKNPVMPDTPPATVEEFEQFLSELALRNNARAVTYTRDYCLKHSDRVAMMTRAFTSGYVERLGVPTPGVNVVYIAGRYEETWIGLHNDFCSTFLVPVYGRKKIMLWPPEYFADSEHDKKPALNGVCFGHVDVSPYASDAVVLDAGPGEILFIPENWWHYNQLPGLETSLALSIGIFSNGTPANSAKPAIDAVLRMPQFSRRADSHDRLPGGVIDSLGEVTLSAATQELLHAIRDSVAVQMVARSTSNGVIGGGGNIRAAADITPATALRGRPDCPVILLRSGSDAGLLFALGSITKQPHIEQIAALVEHLGSTERFLLGDAIAHADHAAQVEELAQSLYRRGIIDIVD